MPNHRIGHQQPSQSQGSLGAPLLSDHRDPSGSFSFGLPSSQLSSSTTLIDQNSMANNAGHLHVSVSPMNIPPSNRPPTHNNRNYSASSNSDFQPSPRSINTEGSFRTRPPIDQGFRRDNPESSPSSGTPGMLPFSSPTAAYAKDNQPFSSPSVGAATASAGFNVASTFSSDYALSVVFDQFAAAADKKMNIILNVPVDTEIDFHALLGNGADPAFDKLIHSLASLATCLPKNVIDAVMYWRKTKIEPLDPQLIRRMSDGAPLSRTKDVLAILKERRSLASVYILCRALIEIVKSFTAKTLPEDVGENLEEIVFNQLKKADPEAIKRSKNRTTSMDLFAQLIGGLSNIRFASVSDRFIAELEKYNSQTIMKERQSHIEMLIRGMRFLKIKIYPLDALEETADFLSSCATFFRNAHGAKVKHSYAKLFVQLLLPIAGVAVAEVNFPAWAKAVDLIYPRATKMTLKPRHFMAGYPLVTTLLCVSRREFFSANWTPFLDSCCQKFSKDKYTRQMALGCVSRLVWSYLFRCPESTSITFKKLDSIIKTIFPPFRRAIYPSEVPLDHFILITYFALMKDVDTAMKNIVYYLMNADNTANNLHWEYINPERMIIAIRAIRLMLADLERGILRPPFPSDPDMLASGISLQCSADIFSGPIKSVRPDVTDRVEEMIYKALLSLDQAFGRLLVLDEKNIVQKVTSSASTSTSSLGGNYSVPMFGNSVSISGASDGGPQIQHHYATFIASYSKEKQAYLDVLSAIVDSMPRLMPVGIPLPRLVEMLARYTVHVDPDVIRAASQALLRIAAQIDSQTVVARYSQFVSRIEDRFADILGALANGPTSSTNHSTSGGVLKLYVDLLGIWVKKLDATMLKDIEASQQASAKGKMDSDSSTLFDVARLLEMIEETEANGILFLCNQSSVNRRFAIQMLKQAAQLEDHIKTLVQHEETPNALILSFLSHNRRYARVYHFLEAVDRDMAKTDKENDTFVGCKLPSEYHTRLEQHRRRGIRHLLLHVAESDHPYDIQIWNLCYAAFFKLCFEHFPETVALSRQNIINRLLQIQPSILVSVETAKAGTTGTLSMTKSNNANQKIASPETIEQWKIYLTFASATAIAAEPRSPAEPLSSGTRKGSNVVQKINSARDLFRMMLHFITCEHRAIREAALQGLGNVNRNVYGILISDLQSFVRIALDDGKQRSNQKPYQNKRSKKHDRLRISLMRVFELTADCLDEPRHLEDKELMNIIMSYIKETKSFLVDGEVQMEWEYHKLRMYLCGLVEKLYSNIMKLEDPPNIMSFETRLSLFKMFEEWCGYGPCAEATHAREQAMLEDVLLQCKDQQEKANAKLLMEDERKALERAALSAMAVLCRGPLYSFLGQKKARQAVIQFDMLSVLKWVDAIFESPELKYHAVAREALEAILIYNQGQHDLLNDIIEQCYAGNPKLQFTQGYFRALADIVIKIEGYPCPIHQIMCLALFKAGDARKSIRKAAINLLRVVEERVFADSCAKEYEIGITSSLPAIYKHTQTLLSARLALDHPEQTYSVLSEITQRFEHISYNSQREVLIYMLPWLRKADLSITQDNELSASAYMVLTNLYYITIKFGDVYVKEIAALWSQLVGHGKNTRAIILYMLDMCLEKRNPWFLIHAKRVFVWLGRTPAFSRIVEEIIAEITPRSMVPQLKTASNRHVHAFPLLFVADIGKALPHYAKRPVFSRGQVAMIFLVDLSVEAGADLAPHLPLLLHAIFVQLDHLTSIVCDQSRCFLINLIHAIIVRQSTDPEVSQQAGDVIQFLSAKEGKRLWAYENITHKNRRLQSAEELSQLLGKVIALFSREDPDLRQKWGETALKWATCCSVRHIACRSFQCFRALMPSFNQHMLADMLARLSNTIADKSDEIRGFALEIILTLNEVTRTMDRAQIEQYPQLFWAAVACLYSPYEAEHTEALMFLEAVLDRYGFCNDLATTFPKNWANEFEGLEPLLLKGLQFESAEEKTFEILSSIILIDNPPLLDPSETRLLYLLLASICRLLHGLDGNDSHPDASAVAFCDQLAQLFERYALPDVHRILSSYPKQKSKFQADFLKQLLGSIRHVFLGSYGQLALTYALLLVRNTKPYYREKGLMLVENVIPFVMGQHPRSSGPLPTIDIATLEPLVDLIHTEYADKALSIFSKSIPISTQSTRTNSSSRSTTSIPLTEPNGNASSIPNALWGLGLPAIHSASKIARHNVHAVVFECSSLTNEALPAHNIQFSIEDFSMLTGETSEQDGGSVVDDDTQSQRVQVGRHVGRYRHGEDLINALKDLDDFFNEDAETTLTPSSSLTTFHRVPNDYMSPPADSDEALVYRGGPSSDIRFDSDE